MADATRTRPLVRLVSHTCPRSTLLLPPHIERLTQSRVVTTDSLAEYDIVSLISYLSSASENRNSHIKFKRAVIPQHWTVYGSGRSFVVRRWQTGTLDEMGEQNHYAPAEAYKSLLSSSNRNPSETSLAYRSLIQELRILQHPPISRHPNLLRVLSLGWEVDPFETSRALPTLATEFAVLGTLGSYLSSFETTPQMKQRLILDVAQGLFALHSCSITHGDIKPDNTLMFVCDDPDFPIIAKLSDFAFSIDTSSRTEKTTLVGLTPLWAAPEYREFLAPQHLHLTDVYSFGLMIWSICLDGQTPLEILENVYPELDMNGLVAAFDFLRDSNELCGVATATIHGLEPKNLEFTGAVCDCIGWTLQLNNLDRSLDNVLAASSGKYTRRGHKELLASLEMSPLFSWDPTSINIKHYLNTAQLTFMAVDELLQKLDAIARTGKYEAIDMSNESSISVRRPLEKGKRSACAAFSLSEIYLRGTIVERSVSSAASWLGLAANQGLQFAQLLCAVLGEYADTGTHISDRYQWLAYGARQGFSPALNLLRGKDPSLYQRSYLSYQRNFWARCYNIGDQIIEMLSSTELSESDFTELLSSSILSEQLGDYGNGLLHCAAMVGSMAALRCCVEKLQISVNSPNRRAETPLLLACRSGHVEVVNYLIQQGADASRPNQFGENGLHWLHVFLFEEQCFDIAWKLLEAGARLHQECIEDLTFISRTANSIFPWTPGTPLHRAVASGNTVVVRILLDFGADPTIASAGWTACCLAAAWRNVAMLALLLQYGHAIDLNQCHPGRYSSKREFPILRRAIESSIPRFALSCIHGTDENDSLMQTVQFLVSKGADPCQLPPIVHYSIITSTDIRVTEYILNMDRERLNEPIDSNGYTPLIVAVTAGVPEMVTLLLRCGANPRQTFEYGQVTSFNLLHWCAREFNRDTKIAQQLIRLGVDVNYNRDPYTAGTPLLYALDYGAFNLADLLIRNGAKVHYTPKSPERGNVLGEILWNSPDIRVYKALEFLFKHPLVQIPFIANPRYKSSVFHIWCAPQEIRRTGYSAHSWVEIYRLLRSAFPGPGAINAKDDFGATALQNAIYTAYPEAVSVLLKDGADIYARAPFDRRTQRVHLTPIEMVERQEFVPIPDWVKVDKKILDEFLERRRNITMMILRAAGR